MFFLAAAVGAAGILWVVAHEGFILLACRAIVRAPNARRDIDPVGDPQPGELRRIGVDRQERFPVGPPAASLSVWILEARSPPARGTVFVLHGIRDSRLSMIGTGRVLSDRGYRAVLVDLRGHGRSTGEWLTFGPLEGRDLKQVADALRGRGLLSGEIGVYGPSFGGAAALWFAAVDPRVKAVVTVSTFATGPEIIFRYVRRVCPSGAVPDAWIEAAIDRSSRLAQADLRKADSRDAVRRTEAALLFIHGRADPLIPWQDSAQLQAAARGPSRLVLVPDENHRTIFQDRTATIRREATGWFDRHLRSGEPRFAGRRARPDPPALLY